MAVIQLKTIRDLRIRITISGQVWIKPQFGNFDVYIQITKQTARFIAYSVDLDTTPAELGLATDYFGTYDEETDVMHIG